MTYHLCLSKIGRWGPGHRLCQAKGDKLVALVEPMPWEESVESTRPGRLEAKTEQ